MNLFIVLLLAVFAMLLVVEAEKQQVKTPTRTNRLITPSQNTIDYNKRNSKHAERARSSSHATAVNTNMPEILKTIGSVIRNEVRDCTNLIAQSETAGECLTNTLYVLNRHKVVLAVGGAGLILRRGIHGSRFVLCTFETKPSRFI